MNHQQTYLKHDHSFEKIKIDIDSSANNITMKTEKEASAYLWFDNRKTFHIILGFNPNWDS